MGLTRTDALNRFLLEGEIIHGIQRAAALEEADLETNLTLMVALLRLRLPECIAPTERAFTGLEKAVLWTIARHGVWRIGGGLFGHSIGMIAEYGFFRESEEFTAFVEALDAPKAGTTRHELQGWYGDVGMASAP
ncbi:hypothetical protein [Deinococcus hopiensis]|uniref:hypothetical protein n=1 Tax=Deinococcus hopiensis TaxID=309885 RepID=UPI00111BF44B|nr:hypothetical protein [Deinococcus hopiensis]